MHDYRVVLTGGSGGLGQAVTRLFLERGAALTVPVLDDREGERLRRPLGPRAAALALPQADLRDEAATERLFAELEPPHALVHLVGGFAMGPTHAFASDALREQLELNVVTAFHAIKHVLEPMRRQGYGRIVTVASQAAIDPAPQLAAYAAAKAAVLALTQSVAAETRGTGVTANSVLPSIIDTPANREAMGSDQADRWVSPARLAETLWFLASDHAGELRGSAVRVYGDV